MIAGAFAELGFRRATTAKLARRCGVRENILYRLWKDKRAMFIAAIDYVYEQSARVWQEVLAGTGGTPGDAAERLLRYESEHYGESGLHRIILAGLSEADDPDIREALRKMYGRFHRFIRKHIVEHRRGAGDSLPDASVSAWAIVGLGNVANVSRELGLLGDSSRKHLFFDAGRVLLDGRSC